MFVSLIPHFEVSSIQMLRLKFSNVSFFNSLIIFRLSVNIVLLGISCKWVEDHQKDLEDKVNKMIGGHSASLPASRHNSVSNLTILDEEIKLQDIKDKLTEQQNSPVKQQMNKSVISTGARSTPHSPLNGSPRDSLEDITEQVAIAQNSLESSIILSDSTVSLISMNDGQNLKLPEEKLKTVGKTPKLSLTKKKIMQYWRRRVSLQELPVNVDEFEQRLNRYTDRRQQQQQQETVLMNENTKPKMA